MNRAFNGFSQHLLLLHAWLEGKWHCSNGFGSKLLTPGTDKITVNQKLVLWVKVKDSDSAQILNVAERGGGMQLLH